ncbi:MAG TPA: NlpC/P60 family protein [Candidatus Angelobacter sp.]
MRVALKFAALQICLGAALAGQTANARPRDDAPPPLLSRDQGQALADFALRSSAGVRPKPDCSHLVHLLYSRAGLNYPYEGSRVLHRGVADFARVKTPQPGDLAVWPGHVGIVLSPADKTFLSSVRSGIITESWTNDYWAARGRPRFFRYIVGPQTNLALLEELSTRRDRAATTASVRRTPQAERPRVIAEPAHPSTASADADDNIQKLPSIIAVIRQRSKPDKADITAAFRQGGLDLARTLTNGDLLDPGRPVSIVERVEVKQPKIRHDKGVVRLKLIETLTLDRGKTLPGFTVERELALNLRDGVWVVSDPLERLYIPRDKAVDVLESQLHLIFDDGLPHAEKRGIVKALNFLYDREAAIPTTATEARQR